MIGIRIGIELHDSVGVAISLQKRKIYWGRLWMANGWKFIFMTNSKNRFQKNRNVLRNWCHLLMKIVLLQYDVSVLAYRCDLLFIDFPRCAAWNIFLFHIPTEWRMNASMLFIIAFVKFGNFSFKIEKKIYIYVWNWIVKRVSGMKHTK